MSELIYLMREICAGIEIYYSGRTDEQYHKTAFVLCDDYTELTSKVFLLKDNSSWSDSRSEKEIQKFEKAQKAIEDALGAGNIPDPKDLEQLKKGVGKGSFKNYGDVLEDVRKVFEKKRKADLPKLHTLQNAMRARRKRRNDFFHSTSLLDLNVGKHVCVAAFCDLLDYGALLFPKEWNPTIEATRNLETLEILLRLEKKAENDLSMPLRISNVLRNWPRNLSSKALKGVHLAEHPGDMHLMLSVIYGGPELKNKLRELL
jgi:hypothetical protein